MKEIYSDNPNIKEIYRTCSKCGYQFTETPQEQEREFATPQEDQQTDPKVCKLLLIVAIAVAIVGVILSIAFAFEETGWVDDPDVGDSGGESYFDGAIFANRVLITAVVSVLLLGFREVISIQARHCREVAGIRKILERNERNDTPPAVKK